MIDATWDDPHNSWEQPEHKYFNLTGEEMKDIGRRTWKEKNYPECNGTKYKYSDSQDLFEVFTYIKSKLVLHKL